MDTDGCNGNPFHNHVSFLGKSTQTAGVAITSVASKMSVIIPFWYQLQLIQTIS
jgi:hypothetical protein